MVSYSCCSATGVLFRSIQHVTGYDDALHLTRCPQHEAHSATGTWTRALLDQDTALSLGQSGNPTATEGVPDCIVLSVPIALAVMCVRVRHPLR